MNRNISLTKLLILVSIFIAYAFFPPRLCSALTHLTTPQQITTNTTLTDDYVCDTTCFVVKGNNITLDFNGHTATFGNANTVTVPNDSFTTWTDDATPADWTILSGTATKTASIFPFGSWDAVVSATAVLKSPTFTLTGGKSYYLFSFTKGDTNDSYVLEVVRASDDVTLQSVTVASAVLSRGYADSGATTNRIYKPTENTDVYLKWTGLGANTKIIAMITMKPVYDYGVVHDTYQSAYVPDITSSYFGASSGVTITNGTITQGNGNGVRTEGVSYSGTNWEIDNMEVNINGINTSGIVCRGCSETTINDSTVNSSSPSVFNRMFGTAGIRLQDPIANYNYVVTNNTITGVPEYGILNLDCFENTHTTSFTISGNSISQNEKVTEGYGICLSGVINATVTNNTITPVKGRGILLDTSAGCNPPIKKGTRNVTVSNNNILGIYEVRNAEYGENALEATGIRIRNGGSTNGSHENLVINGNTITASTDASGVHRAYGIAITTKLEGTLTDSISIYDNNITVSATGADRDANALSLQDVDVTLGDTLDIYNNTFTSTHQAVRFGGNDGAYVKGVTLRSNTLVQTGTPTVAPIVYGYWIGPETGNSLIDNTCNNCNIDNICWDTSGQSDLTMKWYANATVKVNGSNQVVSGATVTAVDSLSNSYTGVTDSNGFVRLALPEYKKAGSGQSCNSSGLVTTTYAPYKLTASKNATKSVEVNFSGTASGAVELLLVDTALPEVIAFTIPSIYSSWTVPITTFTAADDIEVKGYIITETDIPPSVGAAGWSATAPATFTFSDAGVRTAYAWVKDAAGNVSSGVKRLVIIGTRYTDSFNNLNYTDQWDVSNSGTVTMSVAKSVLNVVITRPLSGCSYADLTSKETFDGENLLLETGASMKGYGEMLLRLKKDDDNFVQFGVSGFTVGKIPDFIMGSSKDGTYTEQALNLSAEYAVKKKYKYKTFSIVKTGDDYKAYFNGMDTEAHVTNTSVGDDGLKAELLNGVCSTDLKGTSNSFDYVFVSETIDASIPASDLMLLAPDGGETIKTGSIYLLLWEAPDGVSYYSIDYSTDGGIKWKLLDTGIESKFYTWKLSKEKPLSTYKLRVKAYDNLGIVLDSDASDSNFTIQY